ncbi:MAG: hypothetical protein QXP39_03010 [Candidatus Aenigmatarchaeota archaeon]
MSHRVVKYAKRSLHYIAYGSLAVDVAVAFLTLALITHVFTNPSLLFFANIVLALTVAITIGLCLLIIFIRYKSHMKKFTYTFTSIYPLLKRHIKIKLWYARTRFERWSLTRKKIFGII